MGSITGSITFAPVGLASIPTLGGVMLLLLALFLGFIAFRSLHSRQGRGSLPSVLLAIIALAALLSSVGGTALLRSANAGSDGAIITNPGGESFDLLDDVVSQFLNRSGVTQEVVQLNLPDNCVRITGVNDCDTGVTLAVGGVCRVDCTGGLASDRRLKTDIVHIGYAGNGLPLYDYRYRGHTGTYRGVMAQDVLRHTPEAVIQRSDGYLAVDYGRLGLSLERIR